MRPRDVGGDDTMGLAKHTITNGDKSKTALYLTTFGNRIEVSVSNWKIGDGGAHQITLPIAEFKKLVDKAVG